MMAPHFLANIFIALAVFCLVGGYVLMALILAPFGRTIHLKIVGVFAALLVADYLYSESKNWMRGADYRYHYRDATVYVTEAGPLEFTRERRKVLVTTLRHGSQSHQIGFRINSIAQMAHDRSRRYSSCPTAPREHGLEEIYKSRSRHSCPNVLPGGNRYFRSRGNGTPIFMECQANNAPGSVSYETKYCVMSFGYGHFDVDVLMWKTPRSLWRQARDQVIGILDQSFKVEFTDSLDG